MIYVPCGLLTEDSPGAEWGNTQSPTLKGPCGLGEQERKNSHALKTFTGFFYVKMVNMKYKPLWFLLVFS